MGSAHSRRLKKSVGLGRGAREEARRGLEAIGSILDITKVIS